jgi:OmcA/MtrC family decaheme c-type cytochrome
MMIYYRRFLRSLVLAGLTALPFALAGCLPSSSSDEAIQPGFSDVSVTVHDAGITTNPGKPWVDIEVTARSSLGQMVSVNPDEIGEDFFEFTFTRLVERDGYSSWQPYLASAADSVGIDPTIQVLRAEALRGDAGGEWESQGGGIWRFYLDIDVNQVPAPYLAGNVRFNVDTPVTGDDWASYTGDETHRIGVLLRPGDDWDPAHDFMDFVPNGGTPVDKHVAANASCTNCHELLGGQVSQNSIHGRNRTGVEYCAGCHNAYHINVRTLSPVDLVYLGHEIHSGAGLADTKQHLRFDWGSETVDPTRYMAYYPRDLKNCTTCHDSNIASGAGRIYTNPTIQACGSCHDDVNFATGENHPPPGGNSPRTNSSCVNCHGPERTWDAAVAHVDAARQFAKDGDLHYVIHSIARVDDTLTVEWGVLYDGEAIQNGVDGWTIAATLLVGWGGEDYEHSNGTARPGNALSVSNVQNSATFAGGVYTSVIDISAEVHAGSAMYVASLGGNVNSAAHSNLVARNAVDYLGQERRQVVALAKCTTCHEERFGVFSKHGGARHNDVERCIICHNNNSTDIQRRTSNGLDATNTPDSLDEQATNFMVMAHAIHGQGFREAPIGIVEFSGALNFKDARRYPGRLANCTRCHTDDTYYGMGPRGTTFDSSTGAGLNDVNAHIKTTATMAACSSCHDGTDAQAHMKLMGGVDHWDQATIDASAFEACFACHGPGEDKDVALVHDLD